jgi:TonB family protein
MRSQPFLSALIVAMMMAGELSQLHAAQPSGLKPPRKLRDVKPVYPARSLVAGDEGVVLVELIVGASGSVTDARMLWSKCRALDEAALKAARGWEFEKVLVNGQATPFRMTATVPFRLPEPLKSRAGGAGACRWVDPPTPTF